MLRENDRLRIRLFYCRAKRLPKRVIKVFTMPKVCRNIQSPSVTGVGRTDPLSGHVEDFFFQTRRLFIIQLRQGIVSPPLLIAVVVWPRFLILFQKLKIRPIGTLRLLIRPIRIGSFLPGFVEKRGIHVAMK